MGGFFTQLFSKLTGIAEWCVKLVQQLAKDGWEMATDVPAWCFDQVLGVVVSMVGELDLTGLDQYQNTWTQLPAEIANAAAYLGIVQAGGIIATAIGIRLLLQLIPFTRLGS